MIAGIYLLKFEGTDKVYIGQSRNIMGRYKSHKTAFSRGASTGKLQEAYNTYGMPTLQILIEAEPEELDSLEKEAIAVYDSVENGFNTIDTTTHISQLRGEKSGNAKYTNDLIEEVFWYLVDNKLTHKEIGEITGVSRGTIVDINTGRSHLWLKDKYPEKYEDLISITSTERKTNKNTITANTYKNNKVVSPEGVVYTVDTSLRGFCREHGLQHGGLGELLRGHKTSYRGWKLYQAV